MDVGQVNVDEDDSGTSSKRRGAERVSDPGEETRELLIDGNLTKWRGDV